MKLDPNTNAGGGFGWNIDPPLPPPGQYVAVCLDVKDQFGVDRKAFQSEQMEKRDVTRFLFGLKHPQMQTLFLVQTFEFNISGAANANLVQFLRAWTNRDPYGFDYLELKGQGALVTLAHKPSTKTPGVVYATISSISPVYPTLQAEIPNPQLFTALVAKANSPRDKITPGAAGTGVRKFWTQDQSGQVVLVTQEQLIKKGEPHRMVMAENQQGGWVSASSIIPFPVAAPVPPPAPPGMGPGPTPPAPPAAGGWGAPPPMPLPSAPALPKHEDDEIPF